MPLARTIILTAALLPLAACAIIRPEPPEPVPDAVRPDGTPVVTDTSGPSFTVVPVESKKKRVSPMHISAMLDFHATRVAFDGGAPPTSDYASTLPSIELLIQPISGFGVGGSGRVIRSIGGPAYADAGVLIGTRQYALDLGMATRRGFQPSSGGALDSVYALARVGGRSRLDIGETGFSVLNRAAYYLGIPAQRGGQPSAKLKGWHGETTMSYTFPFYIPVTANLGYRYERIKVYDRQQTLSAFTFGGGVLLGRRPLRDPELK